MKYQYSGSYLNQHPHVTSPRPKIRLRYVYDQCTYTFHVRNVHTLLFTFLSLRLLDRRWERHNFLLSWLFHLTPPRAAPFRKLLVWPRQAPKIDLLRPSPNLNQLFLSNSQILSPSLLGMTSFTSPVFFSYLGFFIVKSVIVPSSPRARVNICTQCLHLTNPCTKPKGSQPN